MPLFQSSVLKKFLKSANTEKVDAAFQTYAEYFLNPVIQENIRNAKEEQFQEGFIRELFVNVFGYVPNPAPDFNITTELKNIKNAKKTDGAILREGKALAVIELKDTNTVDLDKVEIQAFGYKNNQPGCRYVITSNFEKLRFYIDDTTAFEEFNLFDIDQERFGLLYLLLDAEGLLNDLPAKIKKDSILEEENVTKVLYKDYTTFKGELFRDLCAKNPDFDQLLLFKKSQKLLDRLLFIFFAEDKGLLPPNSISRIIAQWQQLKDLDAYKPLYERYQLYFSYIDQGHQGKNQNIFAYNGGLFKPDEVLDSVSIDDELLAKHTLNLTNYDFSTEVDVNILGHIFEHSLNEIEEISAQLAGEEFDKSKTKRKKDGVFYTPKYITKYIVENTIGRLCEEKKEELGIIDEEYAKERKGRKKAKLKELSDKLEAYQEWLFSLTICDPACGSGAFLNEAFDFLIKEHDYIAELRRYLFGESIRFEVEGTILEKNIYGVDLNEEAVEIAKLSLWLRSAKPGRTLSDLSGHLRVGNSLIDDPEVAGEKAFNWEHAFPEVFEKGGFDVVIGNPPYVFSRENFSEEEKLFYNLKFNSADYQINLYLLFIERGILLLKSNHLLGFIIPNAWLMVYSGKNLRSFLISNSTVKKIINLSGHSFQGVNVETVILIASKGKSQNSEVEILLNDEQNFILSHTISLEVFASNPDYEFRVFINNREQKILDKILSNNPTLGELVDVKAGLQAYEKGKGIPKQSKEDVKNRPYDFNYKYNSDTYPYLEGKDVRRYALNWSGSFLLYGENLAAPRDFKIFSGEKIIVREITGNFPHSIYATYSDEIFLFNRSNIAIIQNKATQVNLLYILGIINSKLIAYYFVRNTAKAVRKLFPKIILNDLKKFPIVVPSKDKMEALSKLVKERIDSENLHMDIYESTKNYLGKRFSENENTTTFDKWDEAPFKQIISSKEVTAIKLGFEEEEKLLAYLENRKKQILVLKEKIDLIEETINQMTYELYGLEEEEIELIENMDNDN